MLYIEASRRVSKRAVERIRDAFIEFDHVVFSDVDVPAEAAYQVVHQGHTYVLGIDDPTFDEPLLADCGA